MVKPYKLLHIPTGLYYQPHKHHGCNISTRGKIYQTKTHGLSSALKYAEKYKDKEQYQLFPIFVDKDSQVYKKIKDLFTWEECTYSYRQLKAYTKLTDWQIVEL